MLNIDICKLSPDAVLPTRATDGSAAYDLYSMGSYTIEPGATLPIPLGIAVSIPPGFVGLICSRSGLAARYRLSILNAPGVIDSDYRGELRAIVTNHGYTQYSVCYRDRIAQIMFIKYEQVNFQQVDSLDSTDRGAGGLGSTGK